MSTWSRSGARFSWSDEINFAGSWIIKRAVKQIHADHAERFLLIDIGLVEHADVDDDLARFRARARLKPNPEPAVRFVVLFEAAGRDRVRENKKRSLVPEFFIQAFHQQTILVIEHGLEPLATDIAIRWAVNRIAKAHVVGGHGFRDGPGGAAHEKTACHFLASADLGERSILLCIEIDLERFLVRPDIHLRVHRSAVAAISDRRKFSAVRSCR